MEGKLRGHVPQPRKVTFLGINSATILVLLLGTDQFSKILDGDWSDEQIRVSEFGWIVQRE